MKTFKLILTLLAFSALCVAVFYSIKDDNIKSSRRTTVDSCIHQKELIIKRLTEMSDSSQYYLGKVIEGFGTDSFGKNYRTKFHEFDKRTGKEQIEMEKQCKKIDSIFKIANK